MVPQFDSEEYWIQALFVLLKGTRTEKKLSALLGKFQEDGLNHFEKIVHLHDFIKSEETLADSTRDQMLKVLCRDQSDIDLPVEPLLQKEILQAYPSKKQLLVEHPEFGSILSEPWFEAHDEESEVSSTSKNFSGAPRRKFKTSGAKYCCAVNCHNNTNVDCDRVLFYRFPSESRNPEQRQAWIQAVKRASVDLDDSHKKAKKKRKLKPWVPNVQTVLCSAHFVDNKKSTCQNDPNYVPSIFETKHIKPKTPKDADRFRRANRISLNKSEIIADTMAYNHRCKQTQTDFPELEEKEETMIAQVQCDAEYHRGRLRYTGTQANIPVGCILPGTEVTTTKLTCNGKRVSTLLTASVVALPKEKVEQPKRKTFATKGRLNGSNLWFKRKN